MSGQAREIQPEGLDTLLLSSWAADGKELFVTSRTEAGLLLSHVDLQGKVKQMWNDNASDDGVALQSPDGRHLMINAGRSNSNVWTSENF